MTTRPWLAAALAVIGCGEVDPTPLTPLPEVPAYAVVSADFRRDASSIGLLREDGSVLVDGWVDSGSAAVGLATTLSSDVALPSAPCPDGALTLIDRFDRDVITRVAVPSGEVLAQTRLVERGPGIPAFTANPQDFLCPGGDEALVPRFEPSFEDDPRPGNAGNDVVPVTLATGEARFDRRIDLEAAATPIAFPESRPDEIAPPRPARGAVMDEDTLVIAVARLGVDFVGAGEGAVAVIDLPTSGVTVLPIPGLADCEDVRRIPEDPNAVLVSCLGWAGSFERFLEDEARRPTAGLARIRRDGPGTPFAVEVVARARDAPDAPVAVVSPIPLGGDLVVAVSWGDDDAGRPDTAWLVDLQAGLPGRELAVSDRAFTLGRGTFDPDRRLLLLPDAARGVRRLVLDEAGEVAREERAVVVGGALGAREVGRL